MMPRRTEEDERRDKFRGEQLTEHVEDKKPCVSEVRKNRLFKKLNRMNRRHI